ncbi:MAG: hypothetical protein PHF99_11935 [Bacteroidales bacterium]|nr:hypothetical protein [Bacteroidales bacterium]
MEIFFKKWSIESKYDYFDGIIKPILNISLNEYEELQLLIKEFNNSKTVFKDKFNKFVFSKDKLNFNASDLELIGIDIPFWIKGDNPLGKRVIIVAQEPKRNNDSFVKFNSNKKEQLIIWTPFSYQEKNSDPERSEKIYWSTIDEIASKSSMVYITDINKICYKKDSKISNEFDESLQEVFLSILLKEINTFVKPDIIIAFGKQALYGLCELDIVIKPIYFPHPSSINTHKNKFFLRKLGNNDYEQIVKKNQKEDVLLAFYKKLIEKYLLTLK